MYINTNRRALMFVGDQVEELDVFIPFFTMQSIGWDVNSLLLITIFLKKLDLIGNNHERLRLDNSIRCYGKT